MRVPPVTKPRSWIVRVAYWMTRRQFGRTPTPFQTIYGNAPHLSLPSWAVGRVLDGKLSLDHDLVLLVTTLTSLHNGCTFCADLHRAQAVQAKLGMERFRELADFRTSARFDPSERAALAYADEVTRERKCSDATFEALRPHFDDRAIVELAWTVGIGNFYNLMAVGLDLESDGLERLALERTG